MATTNTKTARTAATKAKAAPAPTPTGTAPTKAAQGTKAQQQAAPQAQLYTVGQWPTQQRGHRAFARTVATGLQQQHPKGFTLAQYRAALVAASAASTVAPPKGGWQGHNMPTWASNPKQGWLVPVGK